MNKPSKSRIGRRIVLLVLFSISLSVAMLTIAILTFELRDSIEQRKTHVQSMGYILAAAVADHVASGNAEEALKALRSIRNLSDVHAVIAVDRDGRQLAALGNASMLSGDIIDTSSGWFAPLSRGWFPVATEIISSGKLVGKLILVADISDLRWQVARTMLTTLLLAFFAGGIGLAAAVRLQRRITAPIASLIGAMTYIRDARDYQAKVTHTSDDETGVLVDAFNGMMQEISYRDESLKKLAYFDPLTGIANRQEFQRHFSVVLDSALKSGTSAALFLIDIDEFKTINDSFGHSAGDSILMDVAARFMTTCSEDQLLARLGGDEFALVAKNVSTVEEAQAIAAPLVASLFKPLDIAGRMISIGASIGVAFMPRDGATTVDLLRRADLALYSAKRDGKGRVNFYHPGLDEDMQTMMMLAQDLRQALAERQFEIHYQPQVNLQQRRVDGFEALLRWNHPERGYVSPARFIPIAESNGLICDIGHWVLTESCAQARHWIDAGQDFEWISVNVSVSQLRQSDFVSEVLDILIHTRLPPNKLCLELTESLFAGSSSGWIKDILSQLKALGVQLAIDDFGTGYSSLAYLLGLPFDKLKIDRAFVHGIHQNEKRRRLLRGIAELAHALNLSTVAEGAEAMEDVGLLTGLGIHHVQGYAFSHPIPGSEVAEKARDIELLLKGTASSHELIGAA
jgi:diguanylate cyclase (GGDEF)-like protein